MSGFLKDSGQYRAVLDTNVLVSAAITEGVCHILLEEANQGNFSFYFSPFIAKELEKAQQRKFCFSKIEITEYLGLLSEIGQSVDPAKMELEIKNVCRDADDDNILAAAVVSDSDFVVTGDLDLLVLKKYRNISILSPKEFLGKLTKA